MTSSLQVKQVNSWLNRTSSISHCLSPTLSVYAFLPCLFWGCLKPLWNSWLQTETDGTEIPRQKEKVRIVEPGKSHRRRGLLLVCILVVLGWLESGAACCQWWCWCLCVCGVLLRLLGGLGVDRDYKDDLPRSRKSTRLTWSQLHRT